MSPYRGSAVEFAVFKAARNADFKELPGAIDLDQAGRYRDFRAATAPAFADYIASTGPMLFGARRSRCCKNCGAHLNSSQCDYCEAVER